MNRKRFFLYASLCLVIALLGGCTMPASKGPTAIPSMAVTQAVETMAAKLTATVPGTASQETTPQGTASQETALATVAKPTTTKAASQPTDQSGEATKTPVASTDTPEPATSTPPTPTPKVTLNPSDPAAGLANPDFHESFDGSSAWYTYQDEFISFQAKNHSLEMTAYQANNRNGWALVPLLTSTKYYVEMTATFGSACQGSDHYGLMISPVSSADKGYLFGVSCDGKYILWKWDGTRMTTLSKWTESTLIQAGVNQTNRIGIKVTGNKLSLYANGELLKEVTDPTYEKYYFGVFVGAAQTAGFTVQVNTLDYWALP